MSKTRRHYSAQFKLDKALADVAAAEQDLA
jgi:hypothetical protein